MKEERKTPSKEGKPVKMTCAGKPTIKKWLKGDLESEKEAIEKSLELQEKKNIRTGEKSLYPLKWCTMYVEGTPETIIFKARDG